MGGIFNLNTICKMKKIVLFLSLVILSIAVMAQPTLKTKSQTIVTPEKWSFNLSVGAADSLGVYQDSLSIPIYINMLDSVGFFYKTKITEVSSPARIVTQYQAKKYNSDNWSTVSQAVYIGSGADTTIYISKPAAYKAYPYNRILHIRTANKVYISQASGYYKK